MKLARVVIASTHSGAGKTTVAVGLMNAFATGGLRSSAFQGWARLYRLELSHGGNRNSLEELGYMVDFSKRRTHNILEIQPLVRHSNHRRRDGTI